MASVWCFERKRKGGKELPLDICHGMSDLLGVGGDPSYFGLMYSSQMSSLPPRPNLVTYNDCG